MHRYNVVIISDHIINETTLCGYMFMQALKYISMALSQLIS